MISIRKAETGDIPRINSLLKQILCIHAELRPDIYRFDREKYTPEEIGALLEDTKRPCIIADKNGECVGYALCQIKESPSESSFVPRKTLYLDDLCVDENERGNGIGKILTDAVVQLAKELNADAVELNVWESNSGALHFYEKYGFSTQRRHMELPLR